MHPNGQTSDPWDGLQRELDAWQANDRVATLWWRDDDATEATPALSQLLDIAESAPVAIAVIPKTASDTLSARLDRADNVTVLQHGFAHRNHAPPSEKKAEFGNHRDSALMLREIAAGQARLADMMGPSLRPVFVPPWNRIAASLIAQLAPLRFKAVSTFGPVCGPTEPPHLNVHVDMIDWRGSRGFVGDAAALQSLLNHVRARRSRYAGTDEATGLMTHHLVHDRETWRFLARLIEVINDHPAARWVDVDTLLESAT